MGLYINKNICTISKGNRKPSFAAFAGNVVYKHLSEDFFLVCVWKLFIKKKAKKSIGPEADSDTSEVE